MQDTLGIDAAQLRSPAGRARPAQELAPAAPGGSVNGSAPEQAAARASASKRAKSGKPTNEQISAASNLIAKYQLDSTDAQMRYKAAKASADLLTRVTGHAIGDKGKEMTKATATLEKTITDWNIALMGDDAEVARKAGEVAQLADEAMMRVLTDFERVAMAAKPDKLSSASFTTPWGNLVARDDKSAATALSYVADLSKAFAVDNVNDVRFFAPRDELENLLRQKPMAGFLKDPESVKVAVEKAARDNKGKMSDVKGQAWHVDDLERGDQILAYQLGMLKILTDQMTQNMAAIAKQVSSETDAASAAMLRDNAEKTSAAFELMGELASCLTDPKELVHKVTDLAVKTGFKLLGKLATGDIRARAEELQRSAEEKLNQSLVDQTKALIKALDSFDQMAPALESQINDLAKRYGEQIKILGNKFDDACEGSSFHFYELENAVTSAHHALDAAFIGREALENTARGLPAAIHKVLAGDSESSGFIGGVLEQAWDRINLPTIDGARFQVEQKIKNWRSNEKDIDVSLEKLLGVRDKAMLALADFGG